jgi:hypothetical protein
MRQDGQEKTARQIKKTIQGMGKRARRRDCKMALIKIIIINYLYAKKVAVPNLNRRKKRRDGSRK